MKTSASEEGGDVERDPTNTQDQEPLTEEIVRPQRPPEILVVGDAAIDWFEEQFETTSIRSPEAARSTYNVQLRRGWKWHEMPGGMLLLDRMLYEILERSQLDPGGSAPRAKIISPIGIRDEKREKFPRDAIDGDNRQNRTDRDGLVHSLAVIRRCKKNEAISYRVWDYRGFALDCREWGPRSDTEETESLRPTVLRFPSGGYVPPTQPQFVVIDDAGNGFRDDPDAWSFVVRASCSGSSRRRPTLIIKMSEPLPISAEGRASRLWKTLAAHKNSFERRLVIVTADDLRRHNSDISFRLSWDRTIEDLIRCAFQSDGTLAELATFGDVIVRFGLDGAALIPEAPVGTPRAVLLICDPSRIEGDSEREIWAYFHATDPSYVTGVTAAFTAAIVAAFVALPPVRAAEPKHVCPAPEQDDKVDVLDAITDGLTATATLYSAGLLPLGGTFALTYPYERIFGRSPVDSEKSAGATSGGASSVITWKLRSILRIGERLRTSLSGEGSHLTNWPGNTSGLDATPSERSQSLPWATSYQRTARRSKIIGRLPT